VTHSDIFIDGVSLGDTSPVCGSPLSLFCVAGWGRFHFNKGEVREKRESLWDNRRGPGVQKKMLALNLRY